MNKKTFQRGLAGLLIAGSGVMSSGCETGAGSLGLGLLLGGIAPSIPVADGGRIVGIGGNALTAYGQAQNNVDTAAAGRSQQTINVNVNNGGNNRVQKGHYEERYLIDSHGNNYIERVWIPDN